MAKVSLKFIFVAYEELAGKYQFDRGGTPIVLLVYVKEGTLMVDEPRYPHARMEPVDLNRLEFRANHENGLYKFRFVRDRAGQIAEGFWIVGEKEYAGFKLGVGLLPSRFTLEQLQEDFQQIQRAMEGMHPAMYDYTSEEDFDVLFDHRFKELNSSMRLEDAFCVFASLMARMGCMHSNVWMPSGYWSRLSIPVAVFAFLWTPGFIRCGLFKAWRRKGTKGSDTSSPHQPDMEKYERTERSGSGYQ